MSLIGREAVAIHCRSLPSFNKDALSSVNWPSASYPRAIERPASTFSLFPDFQSLFLSTSLSPSPHPSPLCFHLASYLLSVYVFFLPTQWFDFMIIEYNYKDSVILCLHAHTHTHAHLLTQCTHTCAHMCMHTHAQAHMHRHTYMYAHTHSCLCSSCWSWRNMKRILIVPQHNNWCLIYFQNMYN